MATTTILDLPNELLEQVATYLDWDPTSTLTPSKPDVQSLSLTTRQMRQAVVPVLFRHVKLRLRWDEGSLLEPKLFCLRREHGHLMKHVRCVWVQTVFRHFPTNHFNFTPFRVPETLQDWLDPSDGVLPERPTQRAQTHRQRVEDVAGTLFSSQNYLDVLERSPVHLRDHANALVHKFFGNRELVRSTDDRLGEDTFFDETYEDPDPALAFPAPNHNHPPGGPAILPLPPTALQVQAERRRATRDLRLQLDALVLVMLCFPPNVKSIILEAAPHGSTDSLKSTFAFHLGAFAAEIFADRLDSLTLLTTIDHLDPAPRPLPRPDLCRKLTSVTSLTLDLSSNAHRQSDPASVPLLYTWHALPPTLTRLSLWNLFTEPDALITLIQGFPSLTHLTLSQINLDLGGAVRHQVGHRGTAAWLHFLISLRRAVPFVAFEIHDMRGVGTPGLGVSARKWMLEAAIPAGEALTFERETRLMEDFEYFLPLWQAEDSLRGEQARIDREDGRLVDAAMGSRWRGVSSSGGTGSEVEF